MLGQRVIVAAPEVVTVVGNPRFYYVVLVAADHIQRLHTAEVFRQLIMDSVCGVAVLIGNNDLFPVFQFGGKTVNIALGACRQKFPLFGIEFPLFFKKT